MELEAFLKILFNEFQRWHRVEQKQTETMLEYTARVQGAQEAVLQAAFVVFFTAMPHLAGDANHFVRAWDAVSRGISLVDVFGLHPEYVRDLSDHPTSTAFSVALSEPRMRELTDSPSVEETPANPNEVTDGRARSDSS